MKINNLYTKAIFFAIICLFIGAIIIQGTGSTVSTPSANIVLSVEVGYRNDEIFSDDFDDGDISDWTVTTAGNGVFEASTDEYVSSPYSVHMKSLNEFDQAMGVSPSYSLNLSVDYEISFYFLIPSTNNHWFEVFNNNQTYLVISSGTQLRWYNGSSSYSIMSLNTSQWYHIELKINSSSNTYDVYIDSEYKTTCDMWIHTGFEDGFRIGDRNNDQGSYFDYGEAYWDDFNINQTYPVHNLDTGEGFLTIQSAIDDSDTLNGHSIEVSNGTYYENVVVNKTVNLIGENRNTTVIDGGGTGDVVNISADWVNISGFTIRNSGMDTGINLNSNCNTIMGSIISGNGFGIALVSSSNNTIINCDISNNDFGIAIYYSSSNAISNCNISNNGFGIYAYDSSSNNISFCSILSNSYGIHLRTSSNNNNISNCNISSNSYGIYLILSSNSNTISNCRIYSNNYDGISLCSPSNIISNCTIYSNSDNGIHLEYSSDNSISNCTIYSNSDHGIHLEYSSDNSISNCTIYSNSDHGIHLEYSSDNSISNCTIYSNSDHGTLAWHSNSNIVFNCTFYSNSWEGVHLHTSSCNNIISNCIIHLNGRDGVALDSGNSNNISENIIYNNSDHGIRLDSSNNNTLNENIIFNNIGGGIITRYSSNNNSINGNNFRNNDYGVGLGGSGNIMSGNSIYNNSRNGVYLSCSTSTINGNNIYSNGYDGIWLESASSNNTLSENIIRNNSWYGIRMESSSHNIISCNVIENNFYDGIILYSFSNNNRIANCTIYNNSGDDNSRGISLSFSSNNTITNCTVYNNSLCGIWLSSSSNNIITNCTVYNNNYGISSSSNNIITIITNCTVYNNNYGISSSSNDIITNCTVYNNSLCGIRLSSSSSSNNIITNCTVYNNNYGIQIRQHSNNNSIIDCNIHDNANGIFLEEDANNNSITDCTIYNNYGGITLVHSSDNNIYHNNFIDNSLNAHEIFCINTWDNDYPSGGNYWSDFDEPSEGAYDNNSDGIVDLPYTNIPENDNSDRYPLMTLYGPPHAVFNFTVDNLTVYLNASLSYDYDGNITSYDWDFGDQTNGAGKTIDHTYPVSGIYNVTLTVRDDDNATNTYSEMIPVVAPEVIDVNQSTFDRGFPIRHAIDGDWAGAQNYIPTVNIISRVEISMRKFGTPEFNLTVELREDHPQGTLLDSKVFTPDEVPSSWEWFSIDFEDVVVTPGTDYFIVCPPAPSGVTTSFGYEWGYAFGNQYADGAFWFTRDGGGLWRDLPTMYEFVFRTYGHS